jgi:hypothetical protein
MNFIFFQKPRLKRGPKKGSGKPLCQRGHLRSLSCNRHNHCLVCRRLREREFRKAAREGYRYEPRSIARRMAS